MEEKTFKIKIDTTEAIKAKDQLFNSLQDSIQKNSKGLQDTLNNVNKGLDDFKKNADEVNNYVLQKPQKTKTAQDFIANALKDNSVKFEPDSIKLVNNLIRKNEERKKQDEERNKIAEEGLSIEEKNIRAQKEQIRLSQVNLQSKRKEVLEEERRNKIIKYSVEGTKNWYDVLKDKPTNFLDGLEKIKDYEDAMVNTSDLIETCRNEIEGFVSTMDGKTIFYNEEDLKNYEDSLKTFRKEEIKNLNEYEKEKKEIIYREEDALIELSKKYREYIRNANEQYYMEKRRPTIENALNGFTLEGSPAYYTRKHAEDINKTNEWFERNTNIIRKNSIVANENLDYNWNNPHKLKEVVIDGKTKKKQTEDVDTVDRKAQQENNLAPLEIPKLEAVKSAATEIKNPLEALNLKDIKSTFTDLKEEYKELGEASDETSKKQSTNWDTLASKTEEYAGYVKEGAGAVFSAMNAILEDQLNEANEKFNKISEQYDKVVEQRKESDDKIKELQDKAKYASGENSVALQEQINQEMEANQKLANQETDLAKKKEKAEKEIKKKEKEIKKAGLAQNIVEGISNVSVAVTKALAVGPISGKILAAMTAAAGAVQVAILTKQYAKLEQGGLLRGRRHSQGGMRVEGTNIEVEGGEYVVNRESTGKNMGLISYINRQRRQLKAEDMNNYFAQPRSIAEVPLSSKFEAGGYVVAPSLDQKSEFDGKELIDAIRTMKIQPRVAVTDILRVQDEMVSVDGWSGM